MFIGTTQQGSALTEALPGYRAMVPAVHAVDAAEAIARCPILDPAVIVGGIVEPDARDIDVHVLHLGFQRGVRERGGRIITSSGVSALSRKGDEWVIESPTGSERFDVVMNAAGAWCDTVGRMAGSQLIGLVPKRRTAFTFAPPADTAHDTWPMVIDIEEQFYFRPEGPQVLASPCDETPMEPHDVRHEEIDVALGISKIEAVTTINIRSVVHAWAGLRSFVTDHRPVNGWDPDLDGFYWLAGQGGFGIKTSPAMARFAAAMILHGGPPADLIATGVTPGSDRRRQIALRLHDLVTLRPHRPDTVQDRDHGARTSTGTPDRGSCSVLGARAGIRRRSGVPLPPGTPVCWCGRPCPGADRSLVCATRKCHRCRGPGERRRGRGVGAVGHMGHVWPRRGADRGIGTPRVHPEPVHPSRMVARRSATPPGGAASLPGCDRCRPSLARPRHRYPNHSGRTRRLRRTRHRGIHRGPRPGGGAVPGEVRLLGRRRGTPRGRRPEHLVALATAATLSPIVSALPAFITLRDNGCSRATAIQEDAMAKWSDIDPAELHPESLMMTYGFRPEWSEGAASPPIFQTSTFVFASAAEGARCFEIAYGMSERRPEEHPSLIYSRINNPNLEIAEERLALWDGAEAAALFVSGMAAITTTLWAHLRPGDVVAASSPVYGGTHHFIETVLPQYGIAVVRFDHDATAEDIANLIAASGHRLGMVYVETPANPTNDLIDLQMCAAVAARFSTPDHKVPLAVDNTFLGPVFPASP